MLIFMLAAAIIGPCMWILGGVGLATHQYANELCDSFQQHVDVRPLLLPAAMLQLLLSQESICHSHPAQKLVCWLCR